MKTDGVKNILVNCDLGEGVGNDAEIMPWIDAVNIACGYHAGDTTTMWQVTELAIKNNVLIGAHPSFPDRENFGRMEMIFPDNEIYDLVIQQLIIINEIVISQDAELHHVKPHGALYNMSAKDPKIAGVIAKAVYDFNPSLQLFGLSNSHSISEGIKTGLQTVNEVFADRTYQDDASLSPRFKSGAMMDSIDKVKKQAEQIIKERTVTSVSGKTIPVNAESICIHGDGEQAVEFAKAIHKFLYME